MLIPAGLRVGMGGRGGGVIPSLYSIFSLEDKEVCVEDEATSQQVKWSPSGHRRPVRRKQVPEPPRAQEAGPLTHNRHLEKERE